MGKISEIPMPSSIRWPDGRIEIISKPVPLDSKANLEIIQNLGKVLAATANLGADHWRILDTFKDGEEQDAFVKGFVEIRNKQTPTDKILK